MKLPSVTSGASASATGLSAPASAATPNGHYAAAPGAGTIPTDQRYFNRDLSWLEFNRRVLAQAMDRRTPLLERVKFLAIFSSNLDEFFMKRVGLLKRLAASTPTAVSPDGLTPRQTLFAIRSVVMNMQQEQAACYQNELVRELSTAGLVILRYRDLTAGQKQLLGEWYRRNVFPVLTPLAVDPGHRFPFISNLSESLGILASVSGNKAGPAASERLFARVKIPEVVRRFVDVPDDPDSPAPEENAKARRYVPLHELIEAHLPELFPGITIHETAHFRITRSTGVQNDDPGADDLLESVQAELKLRRFAQIVRLECSTGSSPTIIKFLAEQLGIDADDVYERPGLLEYGDLWPIADLDRADLKEPVWRPVVPRRLANVGEGGKKDIFSVIRERDVLIHHPYESFSHSVERFIDAASHDPDVLAIKQTLYRTSRDSPFVRSLIRAAESGKQVACLVELRARFDEHRNVQFARRLERAGVHVTYGLVGLKTHCKTSLVVRKEEGGLRCYAHLGTGNYNPKTAQLYTDVSLLTCNPRITEDLVALFNFLTGLSRPTSYQELLVAPFAMRQRFNELIEREMLHARSGAGGRIIAKINSLEDLAITNKLYEASQAGVKITLVVRGFCCLRPGVPGLSDNIEVISVVGRFLEHSRVFHFGNGNTDPLEGDWFIGSADWMYRNLSNRVEAAVPIKDRDARARLWHILQTEIADHRCAWSLKPDGTYLQRFPDPAAEPDSPHAAGTFQTLMWEAQAATRR